MCSRRRLLLGHQAGDEGDEYNGKPLLSSYVLSFYILPEGEAPCTVATRCEFAFTRVLLVLNCVELCQRDGKTNINSLLKVTTAK